MQTARGFPQMTEFTFNFSIDQYSDTTAISSSSSPQIPSTTRYFDLLPPELIRHIFDFVQPSSLVPIPRQHAKSQADFRSLCLTSKRFLDLAHPYLFATLCLPTFGTASNRMSSRFQLDPTLARANSMRSRVRLYTRNLFVNLCPYERNINALRRLVACAEKLESVYVIANMGDGNESEEPEWSTFSCLQPFLVSNIKVLHLSYVIFPQGVPFSFPSLQELSCHQVTLPSCGASYCLPSLRHLLYSSCSSTPEVDEFRYLSDSAPRLASISFSLEETLQFRLDKDSADSGPDVLFAFNIMNLPHVSKPVFPREHAHSTLRLTVEPNFTKLESVMAATGVKTLERWIDAVEGQQELHSSLRTLYLPGDLSARQSYLPWGVRAQVNRLVDLCVKDQVEIVWEGITTDYNAERLLSREFVKRSEQARESERWKKGRSA